MQDAPADVTTTFKQAMRRLTSTISLITTEYDGRRFGMAATAVQSVSTDPATLLICVNRNASISEPLRAGGRFAVNMLHISHLDLVPVFSGKVKDEARFEFGDWASHEGVPVLTDAQATLVCEVASFATVGTHDVIFGKVIWGAVRAEIAPLLYEDGDFVRSEKLKVQA